MKLTEREQRALDFISASCASGVNPTVKEVQVAVKKISFGTAHGILEHLRAHGHIDWIDGKKRSIHPTGSGKQAVRPTPLYLIQERIAWPPSKWKASDGVWLDPKMFNLESTENFIVVQAGTLWAPANFPVTPGEKFVVGPDIFPAGGMGFVHRQGRLEAEKVFAPGGAIFRVQGTGQPIAKKDFLGAVVARVST